VVPVAGLRYLARDKPITRVTDYAVYLSDNGTDWGTPVLTGKLKSRDPGADILVPEPEPARFVKFEIRGSTHGPPVAIAELSVLAGGEPVTAGEQGAGSLVAAQPSGKADFSGRERWRNPEIFEVNREPAHAFSLVFPDAASAAPEPDWADPYAGSSRFRSLNGDWKFFFSDNLAGAPAGFERPEFSVAQWKKLPVPSSWEQYGYGQLYFIDSLQPFLGDPRNPDIPKTPEETAKRVDDCWIPTAFNPVGSYRRSFEIPAGWQGQRVILHFGGVSSAFTCWVNGKEIGYSEDSFSPAEFDITDHLVPGENTLAVQVLMWSDGSYLENQGMARMSGIQRDVLLIARPPLFIADFHLVPTLNKDCTSGTLSTTVTLNNKSGRKAESPVVRLTLLDASGRPVLETKSSAATVLPGQPVELVLPEATLPSPALWHPETPDLYTALIELEGGEVIRQDVAFRRFDWEEKGNFHLNGKRFLMRGVNRHDWSETNGRTASHGDMLADVERMKQLNVDTVRCSHYPNDPRFAALCARHGIVMIDEANVETHRHKTLLSDDHPEWRPQALFRVSNMVMRDRNQPAVIMWSIGNEQFRGWPQTVEEEAKLCKALDPTRGVMAERIWDYKNDTLYGQGVIDFISPMYSVESRLNWYLKHREKGETRPLFWCEYAHAMGNSMPKLQAYWDAFESSDGVNGGCIWSWRDVALLDPDSGKSGKRWLYPGDEKAFEFNLNTGPTGVILPDASIANAKPFELKAVYQKAAFAAGSKPGTVRIKNKFSFTLHPLCP
jgi:beta-galactosidase